MKPREIIYRAFHEAEIIEIPIRKEVQVRFHGIPWDLTEVEAEKIVAVIKALATKPVREGEDAEA